LINTFIDAKAGARQIRDATKPPLMAGAKGTHESRHYQMAIALTTKNLFVSLNSEMTGGGVWAFSDALKNLY
jgi:hypothetical protein